MQTARFVVAVALLDAAAAGVAYWLTSEVKNNRAFIVIGAAAVGLLTAGLVLFLWAWFTAPRRALQVRVDQLEEALQGAQVQLQQLVEDRWGEPLQFLPIYHELRVDVREAIRIISRAKEERKLWPRTAAPEDRKWKKHRQAIATSPWAQIDVIHGELLEAFDHVARLNTDTAMRFGAGRRVRASDDLEAALEALETAEGALDGTIARLELISTPEAEHLFED
jgi:hypothetical protein